MDKVIEFVSNNYIWFIVVGGVLIVTALILLFVKKEPVKEEKVEEPNKPEESVEEIKVEEVTEPVVLEEPTEVKEEPKVEMPAVEMPKVETPEPAFSIESVMNAPIEPDVNDTTETLDIIDEEPEVKEEPVETNNIQFDIPIPEVQSESNVGEVNIPNQSVNTDNANSTSDDDIWKF